MDGENPEFDLQPDPRILPMLGEINLAQWQCLAELIDNSVDGFLTNKRAPALKVAESPTVQINLPTGDTPGARVTVTDTGPGMSAQVLEQSVRAGWSGNNPVDNLGLFGMGFNIATARLGSVTTVWTTREEDEEWHGLKIDFDKLRSQRHFKTPHLTRPKGEPGQHGTEITIERLKPDQRAWLSKPANQSRVRKELSRVYASMLRPDGVPISFSLQVNKTRVQPLNHCVWDESRAAETTRWGTITAVMQIDAQLPKRPFCLSCWQWLTAEEVNCPACGSSEHVIKRKRHVHGWIGLQRYLHTTDYGIDFIRNGRKIETLNKDLFEWRTEDTMEREYPIDDPRNRGRFVGEIHLDHCRVHYTKDRFERTDPAWEEMVGIVRGDGPLRPDKAAESGFGPNGSPLFRLFQAFRRSSPSNARVAGGWAKVLVVKDNDRAEDMAKLFHKGVPEYQNDSKWWELVEEEDNKLLVRDSRGVLASDGDDNLAGFGNVSDDVSGVESGAVRQVVPHPSTIRTPIPSLSREYIHEQTGLRWDVRAYEVEPSDSGLRGDGNPWNMKRQTTGEDEFLLNPEHPVFKSVTMTYLDALLCQLAWSVVDIQRSQPEPPLFSRVLSELRERYAGTLKLDPIVLKTQAEMRLSEIARAWTKYVDADDCVSLFKDELTESSREAVYKKMATRSVASPQETISAGRFLEYAPRQTLLSFFVEHPELFFDGRCWDDEYSDLDFGSATATEEAKSRLIRRYESLLIDAIWLAEQEPTDLEYAPRERLMRASLALDLLVPLPMGGVAEND